MLFVQSLTAIIGATLVAAHGPPKSAAELKARALAVEDNTQLLRSCEQKLLRREHVEKRMQRREEFINNHIQKKRALGEDFTPNPNLFKREFAMSERAVDCVLAPEVAVGPYYVPKMLVRDDIREGQAGIPLLMDVQFVDVNTCNTVPRVAVDFWSCNSTGIYSGFAQERTANLTYLRGIGFSDADGLVQITTNFPGWYSGRATHLHVAAHHNVQVSDSHISGGTVSHVGQIFFPEDTLTAIDAINTYKANPITRLRNNNDFYFNQLQNTNYKALAQVTRIGPNLSDGVIATITVGVNPNVDRTNELNSGGALPGFPGFPGGPGTSIPWPSFPWPTTFPPGPTTGSTPN